MADPAVIDLTSTQPAQITPASHRLPTVSATQALQDLQQGPSRYVRTGIASLDSRLSSVGDSTDGGLERGKVTEIWGPSGSGKTAIALQAAAHSIKNDNAVMWIDAATSLTESRLLNVLFNLTTNESTGTTKGSSQNFHHIHATTLSLLLAMTLHPQPNFIRHKTALLVIDGLNHLLDIDYPRYQIAAPNKTEAQKWHAGRRWTILGTLVSALNKLAALNNMAVIVTTGCSTRMRHDTGAGVALVPGIGGVEWEGGVWNRLVVFRDFGVRFVGVQKCQGRSLIPRDEVGEPGHVLCFETTSDGIVQEPSTTKSADEVSAQQVKLRSSPMQPRKRRPDEIADSDGEDVDEYGWAETDADAFSAEHVVGDG